MGLKVWFTETRPGFLLLTPITYSIGLAVAYVEGSFDALRAVLGLIGVILAHVSINVLNDYFDYRSGLDFRTKRTPFSGGSGILPAGALEARKVYLFAVSCLAVGGIIGVYFALTTGWMLLPLVAFAAVSIYFYTTHLAHWFVGELITGINFGPLMALGGYFIMTGSYGLPALAAGVVPGILVGTLLFLNEFPDLEADRETGRRNAVISLGLETSSKLYAIFIGSTYAWIVLSILLRLMPPTALVAFVTLPLGVKAVRGVLREHSSFEGLIPYLGANVMLVLSLSGMVSLGIMLSLLFR